MNETTPNSTSLDWLISLSPVFILGLAIGYFLKKSFTIFLFIFGAVAVISLVLNEKGLLDMSLDAFTPVAEAGKNSFSWLSSLAQESLGKMTAQSASGLAGFALGLKMG